MRQRLTFISDDSHLCCRFLETYNNLLANYFECESLIWHFDWKSHSMHSQLKSKLEIEKKWKLCMLIKRKLENIFIICIQRQKDGVLLVVVTVLPCYLFFRQLILLSPHSVNSPSFEYRFFSYKIISCNLQ